MKALNGNVNMKFDSQIPIGSRFRFQFYHLTLASVRSFTLHTKFPLLCSVCSHLAILSTHPLFMACQCKYKYTYTQYMRGQSSNE